MVTKRQFKIFFRRVGDQKLISKSVFQSSMQDVWVNEMPDAKTYAFWICIKCCTTGNYAWRDGVIDDSVIIRELAMQKYVEGEKFN
jgi:hypothetical protein